MMEKELVSIIIPVYNSEKYLDQCLTSIMTQTYQNIEILLIDDGSTDQSGAICDTYAAKDSRIHVFHNSNRGVSYSRNCGIKFSRGAFLIFIDSDDAINNSYVEGLMEKAHQYDLMISTMLDVWEYRDGSTHTKARPIHHQHGNLKSDYKDIIGFLRVPHAKLYRSSIIQKNKLAFPENISWGEDEIFNWEYYKYINSYAFSMASQYRYFHRNNNSLSQRNENADNIALVKFTLGKYNSFLVSNNITKKDQLICDLCVDFFLYAGSGYTLFNVRCNLIREYLAGKYSASNWKRWLVLKCIKYEWYIPIYIYYRLKWLKQQRKF